MNATECVGCEMIRHAIFEQIEKLQAPVICQECHHIYEGGNDCRCPRCESREQIIVRGTTEAEVLEALHNVRAP